MAATPPKEALKIMQTLSVGPDAHRKKLEAMLKAGSLTLDDIAKPVIELLHRFALLEFLIQHRVPSELEHSCLESRLETLKERVDDHAKTLSDLIDLRRALGELPITPDHLEAVSAKLNDALQVPKDYRGPDDNDPRLQNLKKSGS